MAVINIKDVIKYLVKLSIILCVILTFTRYFSSIKQLTQNSILNNKNIPNNDNYLISSDYIEADLVIINTCGFIASAKEEAINTIYEVLDNKKEDTKVIVCGCLVERYYEDLKNGIPEVDLFIPLREYFHFGEYVGALFNDSNLTNLCPTSLKRVISTPKHLAYVRISDGCNNRCAYCAIPLIRGNFRSRNKEEILEEIKYLAI